MALWYPIPKSFFYNLQPTKIHSSGSHTHRKCLTNVCTPYKDINRFIFFLLFHQLVAMRPLLYFYSILGFPYAIDRCCTTRGPHAACPPILNGPPGLVKYI